MSNLRKILKAASIALGGVLLLSMSATTIAQPEIQATNDGNGIVAQGYSSDDIASMSIRIVGPDGFVFEERIEDSVIDWAPAGELADGRYTWETRMVTVESSAPVREDPRLYRDKETATIQDGSNDGADSLESGAPKSADQETRKEIPLERFFDAEYKQVEKESGSFRVRDGFIEPLDNSEDTLSHTNQPGLIGSIAGAVLDFVFPSANAAEIINEDVVISDPTPCIRFDDTDVQFIQWVLCANEERFFIEGSAGPQFEIDRLAPANSLSIRSSGNVGFGTSTPADPLHIADTFPVIRFDDTDDAQVWRIFANGGDFAINDDTAGTFPIRILPGAPNDALVVAENGNVSIGNDALVVDDNGSVGIRTDDPNPFFGLTIEGIPASILLQGDSPEDAATIRYNTTTDDLELGDNLLNPAVKINGAASEDSLRIDSNSNVGLGTRNPDAPLHVRRSDESANLLVEETNGVVSPRQLFTLQNNGPIGFGMVNTDLSQQWRFAAQTSGFRVSLAGSGGPEFEVTNDGSLRVGPGSSFNFDFDGNTGNLDITGSLFTGGSTCGGGCDAVFSSEYPLDSIDDHARQMWANHYLPAVGPTEENGRWNLTEKVGGMLNELETAHIYIDQLHNRLQKNRATIEATQAQVISIKAENSALQEQNAALIARLDALEGEVAVLAAKEEAGRDERAIASRLQQ